MADVKYSNERIEWIDIAKGIGMIFVVFGHTGLPIHISSWIYSFHMPLFFLISGMLFNVANRSTLSELIHIRLQTLVKPYIIFSIIVLIWSKMLHYELFNLEYFELYKGWNGLALWFIPVLFLTEICFFILKKNNSHVISILIIITMLSILGYGCYLNHLHLIYKLEVVLTAVFFYGIGNLSYSYLILYFKKGNFSLLFLFLLIILPLSIILSISNKPRLDMASNTIGNYFPTYLAAFLGISIIIVHSFFISKANKTYLIQLKKLIIYIGKNTFVILAFHQVLTMSFKKLFEYYNLPKYVDMGVRQLLLWFFLIFIIHAINRYGLWILGKKK